MCACTGKPQELGGIPHELGTTGYGVSVALKTTIEFLKEIIRKGMHSHQPLSSIYNSIETKGKDIKVVIQGFGNVGSFTAKFLDDLKVKVVGVSDVSGFVFNNEGLNIPQLMRDMREKARISDLSSNQPQQQQQVRYNILDKDEIFDVDTDIFIPAALTGALNDKTAPKLLEYG